MSRSWASREANAPQTRVVLASMLNNRAESITRLIDHALDAIEDALQAVKVWDATKMLHFATVLAVEAGATLSNQTSPTQCQKPRGEHQ